MDFLIQIKDGQKKILFLVVMELLLLDMKEQFNMQEKLMLLIQFKIQITLIRKFIFMYQQETVQHLMFYLKQQQMKTIILTEHGHIYLLTHQTLNIYKEEIQHQVYTVLMVYLNLLFLIRMYQENLELVEHLQQGLLLAIGTLLETKRILILQILLSLILLIIFFKNMLLLQDLVVFQ